MRPIDLLFPIAFVLFLLCYPDIAWQQDALREHPDENERIKIFKLYKAELIAMNKKFIVLKGEKEKRFIEAIDFINKINY